MVLSGDQVFQALHDASIVFWDFDGVVKDSVDVKTTAFVELFLPYGASVAKRVRQHHHANGGMSRFEKVPLYLGWAGETATIEKVAEFCDRFSQKVSQAVIDSPWVPGVHEYLLAQCSQKYFVLVTATPQEEIAGILDALNITRCFRECYGAPTKKSAVIQAVLQRLRLSPGSAIMVGDAETDFKAAQQNRVAFLLRRTSLNLALQALHTGPAFDNLTHHE